jgi:hypothetical protein
MGKEVYLLLLVAAMIFLSGCTQEVTQCGTDVVTIEDYRIYARTLYSGGNTGIDFMIFNNDMNAVLNKVEVNFFDTSGFEISNLKCGTGTSAGNKCVFYNLQPDVKDVSLRLKAPAVSEKTSYTVSFSVGYSDSGQREIQIPIIDSEIRDKPSLTYSVSYQSCDPIQVEFEKEVKPEETETEYWTSVDMPFEMKFVFSNVGTIENVEKVELKEGSVSLDLNKLQIQEPCDFDSNLKSKKSIDLTGEENERTLRCNFKPIPSSQPEYFGVIGVKYNYDYEYVKSETFTVYPSG